MEDKDNGLFGKLDGLDPRLSNSGMTAKEGKGNELFIKWILDQVQNDG